MINSSKSKSNLGTNESSKPMYMGKVIVLGNSSVGKTSILTRYTWTGQGSFQLSHTPTIGVDFKTKTVEVANKSIKLQLWDTAGQQRFRTLTDNYYTGASGIVLVYSITDRKSFEEITEWMYQISSKTNEDIVKIIIANKCDVAGRNSVGDEKRVVEIYEGKMLAQKYKCFFMEVSAKQNININQAFNLLATKMIQKFQKDPSKTSNSVLVLDRKKEDLSKKQNKKACCG